MVTHCDTLRTIRWNDVLVKLADLYHCACQTYITVPLIRMGTDSILDSDMIPVDE